MYSRKQAAGPAKMTFEALFAALGHDSTQRCSQQAGLPLSLVEQAALPPDATTGQGTPIAESYARRICAWLSKEYERDISHLEHVAGLNLVKPGRERQPQDGRQPEQP